jgi:hypothetical protein
VTPPEPESDEVPDEEWLEESPLKKLDRDDQCEPPPDEPVLQLVLVCAGAAAPGTDAPGTDAPGTDAPGGVGSQFRRGISV